MVIGSILLPDLGPMSFAGFFLIGYFLGWLEDAIQGLIKP